MVVYVCDTCIMCVHVMCAIHRDPTHSAFPVPVVPLTGDCGPWLVVASADPSSLLPFLCVVGDDDDADDIITYIIWLIILPLMCNIIIERKSNLNTYSGVRMCVCVTSDSDFFSQ